ncbi:hypothetical protein F383_25322 [Gossypium arboreum]|uniref:Uncharacterized protein n=1 Tax=Gossypium arboreum TaxID=29729 RepID=A0A0B0P7Z7_GOSAR|nr:hypothetical protein F383_25322 [Gossypium arboreum]
MSKSSFMPCFMLLDKYVSMHVV